MLSVLNFNTSIDIYNEKAIIMVVQATPNIQFGGDHGAFSKLIYQSESGALFIKTTPIYNAKKLKTKNINVLRVTLFKLIIQRYNFCLTI